jgi:dolichol-phosphate mannosyltransferase
MTKKTFRIINRLLKDKVFRFLVCGAITAAFNVLLLVAVIKVFGIKTPLLRNLANVFSIEVSLLFSFFVYRTWVWSIRHSTIREVLFRQVPLYHLSVGVSIVSRSLIIFPLLDWLGVHYAANTLVGIVIGSVVNYKISDKWVFKASK